MKGILKGCTNVNWSSELAAIQDIKNGPCSQKKLYIWKIKQYA